MLASGPALLTALSLLQADAQFGAGARIETRAGQAPSFGSNGLEQKFQVVVAAIPTLSVRLLDEISNLTASSATRIYWRTQPSADQRPLFLETIEINHTIRPSKRSTWTYNLRTSYGEEDYLFLSKDMPNQPTLPRQLTMLSLSGGTTASWKTSRRGTLYFQASAVHRRTTDTQATSTTSGAVVNFPPQTTVAASPGMRYQASRRTLVEVLSPVGDTDIRGAPLLSGTGVTTGTPTNGTTVGQTTHLNIFTVQPQLVLAHNLTRYERMRLIAGATYALTLAGQKVSPLYPLFQVDLDSILDRARGGPVWRSTLSAGTTWYADPVLGVAVSRGFVQGSLNTDINRAWSASARLSFATDFSNLQKKLPQTTVPLDETVLSLDVPIRYRGSSRFFAEFGGSFAERGPYLDSHFSWNGRTRELWLFLNINAVTAASRAPTAPRL